jgi:hypothetical protein
MSSLQVKGNAPAATTPSQSANNEEATSAAPKIAASAMTAEPKNGTRMDSNGDRSCRGGGLLDDHLGDQSQRRLNGFLHDVVVTVTVFGTM